MANNSEKLSPVIAIVGSDGAGKTTVSDELLAWLRKQSKAEYCHLGKQTGNLLRSIRSFPLLGSRIDKATRKRTPTKKEGWNPGPIACLAVLLMLERRLYRYRRMMRLRRNGFIVLADRFPQIGPPGKLDSPEMYRAEPTTWYGKVTMRREQSKFEWMASYAPALVVRLNVDIDTAFARKPDHEYASLSTKIEAVKQMTFGGAQITDIDATRPLKEVVGAAQTAIRTVLDKN